MVLYIYIYNVNYKLTLKFKFKLLVVTDVMLWFVRILYSVKLVANGFKRIGHIGQWFTSGSEFLRVFLNSTNIENVLRSLWRYSKFYWKFFYSANTEDAHPKKVREPRFAELCCWKHVDIYCTTYRCIFFWFTTSVSRFR